MIKLFKLFILALLLQACSSNNFLTDTRAGDITIYDKRPLRTIQADHTIRAQINNKIGNDPEFKASHIVVSSFNHTVLMTGQAALPYLRIKAVNIARKLPNVKRVYNQITIGNPSNSMQRTHDTWITTKIKTKMLAAKNLKSGQIKVLTEDGTAFLLGQVNPRQAELAVDIARRVSGVKKVVKVFEYTS